MFKKSYNRALLRIRVETVTPLLIKAGDGGLDPTAADLTCVRTRHLVHGTTVYIPGSSLRGVLRSTAEASVRDRKFGAVHGACDPLNHPASCARFTRDRTGERAASTDVYRQQCLACRLFGSLALKGRAAIRDLFPWRDGADLRPDDVNYRAANHLELRHGVAINRQLGSVESGRLFEQEIVPAGVSFWGEIALENYQVWQLGLLDRGLADISEGFAQLGSSKSRGLGVARVAIESLIHEQAAAGRPQGLGRLATRAEQDAYGLFKEVDLPDAQGEARGLAHRFVVTDPRQLEKWRDAGRRALGGLA